MFPNLVIKLNFKIVIMDGWMDDGLMDGWIDGWLQVGDRGNRGSSGSGWGNRLFNCTVIAPKKT